MLELFADAFIAAQVSIRIAINSLYKYFIYANYHPSNGENQISETLKEHDGKKAITLGLIKGWFKNYAECNNIV